MKMIRVTALLFAIMIISIGCINDNDSDIDFSNWNEERVFKYLAKIKQHINDIPVIVNNRDDAIKKYEKYFTIELSNKIFDSMFVQINNQWRVSDGDAGYIFTVPSREEETNKVDVTIEKDELKVRITYEIGMYSIIEYTIRNQNGEPVITEWKQE